MNAQQSLLELFYFVSILGDDMIRMPMQALLFVSTNDPETW